MIVMVVDEGASCRAPIYRGLSSSTGRHFYSKSQSLVSSSGYNINEGIGFYVYKNQVSEPFLCIVAIAVMDTWQNIFDHNSSCEILQRIRAKLGIHCHNRTQAQHRYTDYINSIDNHFYTRSFSEKLCCQHWVYLRRLSQEYGHHPTNQHTCDYFTSCELIH